MMTVVTATIQAEDGPALTEIKQDGKIHLGMYLNFEGLSFRDKGKTVGLEVELAKIVCTELSQQLGMEVKPDIVNQEWGQIVAELNNGKYQAVFSALIPANLYDAANINYSHSYLDTGPVICTQKAANGAAAKPVTEEVGSLANKTVVVINDPAVRRVLRLAGVFVPADAGKTDLERAFPKEATEAAMAKAGKVVPLVPVTEIRQLDEMPAIYELIASGAVDAGVIDLGIIWWVSTASSKWAPKILAFKKPVGPYIYCAATRAADKDLCAALNTAIAAARVKPEYTKLLEQWHGGFDGRWSLEAGNFLK
jgi:ABC-type amino acid transport substrate-binding protein